MKIPLFMVFVFALEISANKPLHPYINSKNLKVPTDVGEALYLTPYINSGDIDAARKLSLVTDQLDGIRADEQPESYSGFLTVKNDTNSNMFFWFIPATDVNSSEAPVTIWLQGGPGSSSMFGLLELHGPFTVNYVNQTSSTENDRNVTAEMNPYAWSKKSNMIYIDNPVGAGFSYSTEEGLPSSQEEVARDLYEFLIQWFTIFPEYLQNDFYVFGESYGGKWVPTISKKIHDENENSTLKINLVGLGIGNGFTSPNEIAQYADFMYGVSLVDIAQRETMLKYEEEMKREIAKEQWPQAFMAWVKNLDYAMAATGCDDPYEINLCVEPPERSNYDEYLNLKSTRKAIHVGSRPFGKQSYAVYLKMVNDFMQSEREVLEFLLDNYRVLVYNGNFDIICSHYGTKEMFKSMTLWSGRDAYLTTKSTVYRVHDGGYNRTAGYLKSIGTFRQLVMRNSGHMVPWSEPKYAQDMFERFLDGTL